MTSHTPQSISRQDFQFLPGESVHQFWLAVRQYFGAAVDVKWRNGVPVVATCLFADDANRIAFAEIRQPATGGQK